MPSPLPDSPKQNRILASLTSKEYVRLVDDLELVSLKRGQILYEPGDIPDYVYFPTTCIVSRIYSTENGASAELAMTGDDGLVGISLILGGESILYLVDVQSPGNAYRLKAEVMRWELDQGGELQRLSLRYTQALMTQMAQSVICNRHHTVDQQLCRWLLLSLDRAPGDELDITQERIAHMLGVRREGVTEAAGKLQAAGLIHYSRGHITVIDRPGLEARVCECYAAVKSEQERLYHLSPEIRVKSRARPNPATLRRRAETRFHQTSRAIPDSPLDSTRLLHELQVHQIELEMQQEELQAAYGEADALREHYADIYDFAPTGYFTLDSESTILDLNLAGAILLGIKRSQKSRYRFASSVAPESVAAFSEFLDDVLKNKGKKRCEIALLPNAHRAQATVRIEAVPDENGAECRMVVIDITSEKKTERTLFERDQFQRALLDNFPFMVWLKDEQGRFLAVNTPLVKDIGWPSTEALVGKTDFDIYSRDLAESFLASDMAVLSNGETRDFELILDIHGEERWFEVYKSPIAINGQRVGTVGFARDITERHNMQQALADSESQQRSFMENLPLGVTISQDGVLKYMNPKAVELSGFSAEEIVGQEFLPLVVEADRLKVDTAHQQRMRGDPSLDHFEVQLVSKTGRIIDCLCHFNTVQWDKRNASLAIIEDITEKNRMKAELRSLESIDLLTHLANQRHFMVRMEEELSRLHRDIEHQVALLVVQLEHGPDIGETPAQAVNETTLLSAELRKSDIGGRIGDAEFAVLLPETDLATASVFAERLRKKAVDVSALMEDRIVFTVSIGLSVMCASDAGSDQVLERAREALQRARAGGPDRIEVAASPNSAPSGVSSEASKKAKRQSGNEVVESGNQSKKGNRPAKQ